MSILGSLIVELRAETASFIAGMTGASKTARTVGREIESSFSQLGNVAATALAPLGALGSTIAQVLGGVGASAGAAIESLGKFGSGATALTVGLGATAGAAAAVSAGAIGLAIHTAQSAAKMLELSQSTGVSVSTLSGFAFVAKQSGVDSEAMTKGLEKLSKSIFTAATAAPGTVNAFTRMGISVRDSNGQVKDAGQVMEEIAGKFSNMQDGAVKTGLAMQLFGKGGAAVIPMLNEGREGMEHWIETAKSLGIILDTETAESAHKFTQKLNEIEAAGQGASLILMKELLPALHYLSDELVRASQNGDLKTLVHDMAELTRITVGVGDTFAHVFEQIGALLEYTGRTAVALFNLIGTDLEAIARMSIGDFSGAKQALKGSLDEFLAQLDGFDRDSRAIWEKNADFINGIYGKRKINPFAGMDLSGIGNDELARAMGASGGFATGPMDWAQGVLGDLKKKPAGADLTEAKAHRDIIAETIGKLKAQTEEEAALANAISSVTANTILATAAAEAEKIIAETNVRAQREKKQLTEDQKQQIKELVTLKDSYNAAYKDNKGLEDFIQKTTLQTKGLAELAAAYGTQTPMAIEQAKEAEKLNPYQKQITDIQGVIAALKGLGASDAALAPLINSLAQLQGKLAAAQVAVHNFFITEETKNLKEATDQIDTQTRELDKFTPAVVGGAEALRKFNLEQQVRKFSDANPLLSPEQIDQYRASLKALQDDKRAISAGEKVASFGGLDAIKTEIDDLELLRQKEIQLGQDTTVTDLLIYQDRIKYTEDYMRRVLETQNAQLLGDARIFDAENQLIKQWDDAAAKVGTYGQKFQAVMNEVVIQGREAGAAIQRAFVTAIDSIEGAFAKLLTGQKANFKQIFQNLAEQVTKAEIQKGVGAIAQHFGLKIPGLGGKPDGSTDSLALYVRIATGSSLLHAGAGTGGGGVWGTGGGGGVLGSGSGAEKVMWEDWGKKGGIGALLGGVGGFFKKLFGRGGSATAGDLGAPTTVPGVTGAVGDLGNYSFGPGGLGGIFPGLAEGGDMTPGKWYITGEKGPELRKGPGTIVPFDKIGGKGGPTIHQTNNFNLSQPVDMFKRSDSQLLGQLHRTSAIAYARGG